jgi:hypothetical protein
MSARMLEWGLTNDAPLVELRKSLGQVGGVGRDWGIPEGRVGVNWWWLGGEACTRESSECGPYIPSRAQHLFRDLDLQTHGKAPAISPIHVYSRFRLRQPCISLALGLYDGLLHLSRRLLLAVSMTPPCHL